MENNQLNTSDNSKAKKVVIFSLGTLTLGALAFLGFKHFKKPKKNETINDNTKTTDVLDVQKPVQTNPANKPDPGNHSSPAGSPFPLAVGSKGTRVTELQNALLRNYGSSILPKYGADGRFGTELLSALRAKGYGVPVQEAEFKKITQTQTPAQVLTTFDAGSVANGIYTSIIGKDYNSALTLLKAIGNPANYFLVSEKFKSYRLNGGVRQTLVTAMFNSFSEKSQKENTKQVFLDMGLKYDTAGDKWSLSGLDGFRRRKINHL